MRRTLRAVALVGLLVLLAAACSAREKKSGGTSGAEVSKGSSSSSSSASGATGAAPLGVTAGESGADQFSFTLSANSVPSGPVAVTLTNPGAQEHQVTLIKLGTDSDFTTYSQAVAADGAEAALGDGTAYSGPNAVAPGTSGEVTAVLTPGDYALVCLIPGTDGSAHAQHGMLAPLTVEQPVGSTSLPAAAQGTIGLAPNDQMSFSLSPGFNGKGTYDVTNQGTQLHEAAFYKLADGKTQADVVTFFEVGESGPPPITGAGGATALAPGATVTTQLNLGPGSYVLMCFLPDPTNGFTPHYQEGMITTVNVS